MIKFLVWQSIGKKWKNCCINKFVLSPTFYFSTQIIIILKIHTDVFNIHLHSYQDQETLSNKIAHNVSGTKNGDMMIPLQLPTNLQLVKSIVHCKGLRSLNTEESSHTNGSLKLVQLLGLWWKSLKLAIPINQSSIRTVQQNPNRWAGCTFIQKQGDGCDADEMVTAMIEIKIWGSERLGISYYCLTYASLKPVQIPHHCSLPLSAPWLDYQTRGHQDPTIKSYVSNHVRFAQKVKDKI